MAASVLAVASRALLDTCRRMGLDAGRLASRAGLTPEMLADPDARIPFAELVDLKFFCGFSLREIAAMRGVSERTAQRDWSKARLFLHELLVP